MASVPFSTLIDRVRSGVSSIELVYTSHERWPLPRLSPLRTLRVSILDSSFNPPSLAHLALVNAPHICHLAREPDRIQVEGDYDAKLLLLSVRNADKQLKPGDATYVQRLEMMVLLAKDIVRNRPICLQDHFQTSHSDYAQTAYDNAAVAIIDEPTFVGKSKALIQFLRQRVSSYLPSSPDIDLTAAPDIPSSASVTQTVRPQLTFLVGMDTLERLFAPRFYPSEEAMLQALRQFFSVDGDDARVVCARRVLPGIMHTQDEKGQEFLGIIHDYLQRNRVTMIEIGEHEKEISSTQIRNLLGGGDNAWRRMTTSSVAEYITQQGLYSTT
ncbi:uncharacterized protein FIBRA_01331 [Fibroporia radiculosa]|uniref:Nicotinamide-nucleotide adenylyltransferase n=1 Tax=Fibroporia radiculosa TaxID=599839 RepID=J4GJW0_9APHY|nr:uncharacterized protein FIBRA_01331 [Fibroporia radiculosa]CCL99315.1 predicted protein [Fibroporia radiculosa]